ncbi:hypothetical protein HHX47_DHR3000918 [Lentinula edodes]|nr:hypothetical protein HHX47_DHR3000918 [Lentinula edodes]
MSSQQQFTTASSPEIRITTATHFHPAMSPTSLKSKDLQESDVMICRAQRVPLQAAVGKLVSSIQCRGEFVHDLQKANEIFTLYDTE